jgi:hypothetical protein
MAKAKKATPRVRFDRLEVYNPDHDEYHYLLIDSEGDVFLNANADESGPSIMIRKPMVPAIIKALRAAIT